MSKITEAFERDLGYLREAQVHLLKRMKQLHLSASTLDQINRAQLNTEHFIQELDRYRFKPTAPNQAEVNYGHGTEIKNHDEG